jgi:hypothetical protein
MSFRELRNFTEIMRSLGYPRRISVESFREPNFELVADCLLWMARKYDPMMPLLDDIDSPDDRISFANSMTANPLSRGRIKLNGKRLYRADGQAVKELLKLAAVLNASNKAGEEGLIKSVSAQLLGGGIWCKKPADFSGPCFRAPPAVCYTSGGLDNWPAPVSTTYRQE